MTEHGQYPTGLEGKPLAEVIADFESTIRNDPHSFRARFQRSLERRELTRRGMSIMEELNAHLQQHPPPEEHPEFPCLKTAYKLLKYDIVHGDLAHTRTTKEQWAALIA